MPAWKEPPPTGLHRWLYRHRNALMTGSVIAFVLSMAYGIWLLWQGEYRDMMLGPTSWALSSLVVYVSARSAKRPPDE